MSSIYLKVGYQQVLGIRFWQQGFLMSGQGGGTCRVSVGWSLRSSQVQLVEHRRTKASHLVN
jgi:hypothetical protein